jgi:putative phosphoesterase
MKRFKVGLVSDTHGWSEPFLAEAFKEAALIVHAGDIGTQAVLDDLEAIAPLAAVKGNIDGGDLRFLPLTRVEEVGGKRIGVLHIAGSPRKPNATALKFIKDERLDVLVVGHSHIPVVARVGQCLWVNPGAAGRSGFHTQRHAAILWVGEDGSIGMDRIELGPRTRS